LLRILLAAAITALTRAGALIGAIALPRTSRALPAGAQALLPPGLIPPELPHAAEAPPGASASTATAAPVAANPALIFRMFEDKPISFVGLRG
jgi:hypothetical protein